MKDKIFNALKTEYKNLDDKTVQELESEIERIISGEIDGTIDPPYPCDPESPYLPKQQ